MARSTPRRQPARPKPATVPWREYRQQRDTWSVRQFALLCCGVNPNGVDNFPDVITQEQVQ